MMANSKLGEQQMRTTLDDSWQATTTENFDNYNLATTCPNLRMVKLIRAGAPRARDQLIKLRIHGGNEAQG